MPWLIGIDEAGYGPNLGPLVQTAVAFHFKNDIADLWQVLDRAVRKHGKGRDHRLTIDDSKKVYGPTHDFKSLERAVAATLLPADSLPIDLERFLQIVAGNSLAEVRAEPWYRGDDSVPVAAEPSQVTGAAERFDAVCRLAGVKLAWARCLVTVPKVFNDRLDAIDNKSEVLAQGVRSLIRSACSPDEGNDVVVFAVDRLGGRMYHSNLLQSIGLNGAIDVVEESETLCEYRHTGEREIRWSFEVEADGRHLPVALASMISKYLREVMMRQFNRFWREQTPGLKPTAGYPTDAARFIQEIRPAMSKLGIDQRVVWRRK